MSYLFDTKKSIAGVKAQFAQALSIKGKGVKCVVNARTRAGFVLGKAFLRAR